MNILAGSLVVNDIIPSFTSCKWILL